MDWDHYREKYDKRRAGRICEPRATTRQGQSAAGRNLMLFSCPWDELEASSSAWLRASEETIRKTRILSAAPRTARRSLLVHAQILAGLDRRLRGMVLTALNSDVGRQAAKTQGGSTWGAGGELDLRNAANGSDLGALPSIPPKMREKLDGLRSNALPRHAKISPSRGQLTVAAPSDGFKRSVKVARDASRSSGRREPHLQPGSGGGAFSASPRGGIRKAGFVFRVGAGSSAVPDNGGGLAHPPTSTQGRGGRGGVRQLRRDGQHFVPTFHRAGGRLARTGDRPTVDGTHGREPGYMITAFLDAASRASRAARSGPHLHRTLDVIDRRRRGGGA